MLQEPSVFLFQYRAAASGYQHPGSSGKFLEQSGFPCPEAFLTFDIKDQVDAGAGSALDLLITVDEFQPENVGHALAQGGLARTHWANQVEIADRLRLRCLSHDAGKPGGRLMHANTALGNMDG